MKQNIRELLRKERLTGQMESPVPSLHHQTQTKPNLTATSISPREGRPKWSLWEFPGQH